MRKYKSLVLICVFLAGCQQIRAPSSGENNEVIFLPPTPDSADAAVHEPTQGISTTQGTPSIDGLQQQPDCIDNLVYIADKTIPDGTQVSPGAVLDKQWEVENQGNCNWDKNYRLKLIAGPRLSAPPEQALYPARSGSRAIIRILFIAPQEAGNYRSAWQAYSPSGRPFGDPIFIDFIVEESTPTP